MTKTQKNFEAAMSELEKIVNTLEKGELPLEETLKQFEQGMTLSQYCHKSLQDAQKKIDQLIQEQNDVHNK
jgi:exodeoxyribonuclease VII small subunit